MTLRTAAAIAAAMAQQNHLYLVDGSSYIFRAYHRLPPLTNPEGTPVGAVYGYTTMLWKLADDLHKADGPTHMAVILDKSSQSFRNELYDQYKAHRPEPPEDLRPQFPLIRDATRAFSMPCIEEDNVEADDIIASYAKDALAKGWKVTIVSSDKDLMQLIQPGLDMLDTMKNARLGPEAVMEKFGVTPEQLGDVLALMGDAVDNVPGIRGIGPKTASKLIVEHGDLESVLAAAPSMKPSKMRDSLIEQADMARLSKVLVTLKDDCPLPNELDDFLLKDIPPEPLAAFLTKHGFTSLLRKLGASGPADAAPAPSGAPSDAPRSDNAITPQPLAMPAINLDDYVCVQDVDALDAWIAKARAAGMVAVDTETNSLDSMQAALVGVSLAVAPGEACYIPLGHGSNDMFAEKPQQIALGDAIARLKPLLEDDAVLKIGQNLKYDLNVLARHGVHVSPIDDTMVMSFNLDAGQEFGTGGHGMDALADRHLGHQCISFKSLTGTGKKQIGFNEVPLADATRYAAEDADVTLRLWHVLRPRLPVEGATRIYQNVDRPLIPVVAGMERHGIKVDREQLAALSQDFATRMAALEGEIHELAGQSFAIGSPKQLARFCSTSWASRAAKRARQVPIRPTSPCSRSSRAKDRKSRARCSTGGSCRSSSRLIPMRCRNRSTRTLAACTPATAWSARRPGGCPRPSRTSRTSRSAPRSAARSAMPLSPNPAMSSSRRTIARSNLGSPRTWPMSRRCAMPLPMARTSITAPRRSCSARSIAIRAGAPRRSTSRSSTAFRAGAWPDGSR
jgi:DNA polymerase-1